MSFYSLSIFPFLLFGAQSAIFDRNYTKPYVLKKTWVQNFIKFQYIFEGKQGKAKIVPLGCVPSNVEDGTMLKVGEQFSGHDFVFSCEQGEDGVLSYEAIACVDAYGHEMSIGETRRLSNGTVVLHCNIFGGALKKVVERAAGCYFNETIFGEDQQWIEPTKKNGAISGRLMQCFRPHYSYYESHVIGCAIGRLGVRVDEFAQLSDGKYVKCIESEPGVVALKNIDIKELSCLLDNVNYSHEQRWEDPVRAAEMHCSFGHLLKTGCLLEGKVVPIGQELKISNGCVFLCHPQSNVYICDKQLGNFSVVDGHSDSLRKMFFH